MRNITFDIIIRSSLGLLIMTLLIGTQTFPFDHVKPVPSLPKSLDPTLVSDVYSIHAIAHVHRTLFAMNSEHEPAGSLVDDFQVSSDGLTYSLEFPQGVHFHSGHLLSAADITYSFKRAIQARVPGHEKLLKVIGVDDFLSGKTKKIRGLSISQSKSGFALTISLKSPMPRLPEVLSDYRFSILRKGSSPDDGLGPYKLKKKSKIKWVFERSLQLTQSNNIPNRLIFSKSEKPNAIKKFSSGEYHDLLMYPLEPIEIESFKRAAAVIELESPRTYFVALNARTIKNKLERKCIRSAIQLSHLLEQCFPGRNPTMSYIPPGFLGYIDDFAKEKTNPNSQTECTLKRSVKLYVVEGTGNEKCSQNYFAGLDNGRRSLKASIKDAASAVQDWGKNRVDALLLYIESEPNLDLLQFFDPNGSLSFGVPRDTRGQSLLRKINLAQSRASMAELAEEASRYFLAHHTVLPLFHPKVAAVYSNRYQIFQTGFRSPTYLTSDWFRKKDLQKSE